MLETLLDFTVQMTALGLVAWGIRASWKDRTGEKPKISANVDDTE